MKTRILVVDDESEFTSMIKASLESAGYYVVAEENDEGRAVTTSREFGPDLILLDIMMPQIEGNEVAEMIRQHPELQNIPILFFSALISELDAPKGSYTSGGNTFVAKSLSIDRLMSCINDVVEDHRKTEKFRQMKNGHSNNKPRLFRN